MFRGSDFSLVAEYTAGNFAGHCSPRRVCLGVKKRDEVREGESGEEGDVGFYGRQEKSKYIRLGCGGVQVCAVGVISDFLIGVCKNLIDIFYNRIVSIIDQNDRGRNDLVSQGIYYCTSSQLDVSNLMNQDLQSKIR